MQRFSIQYRLNRVCILLYASNLGSVCPRPPAKEVLVNTIPAGWGTRNMTGTLVSKCPLVICVPKSCCHVFGCRSILFQVKRSWGLKPNILFSFCFEADQLLSIFLLSAMLSQFLCESGGLPIYLHSKPKALN